MIVALSCWFFAAHRRHGVFKGPPIMRLTSLLAPLLLSVVACTASTSPDEASNADDVIANGVLPLASDLPAHCKLPEVKRVTRDVARTGKRIAYGYRFKAAAKGAPTVVFFPGGPGGTSMDAAPTFVPEGWGYLMTDPRGVGCNRLASVPDETLAPEFFQTSELAKDVVAAITNEKLDAYVLFGVSYGTLLGSTVAHELEAQNVTAPKAVVLEGVLGRAFGEDFVGAEYIRQFDRIRGVLPADVLTELATAKPYGLDATQWSRALMGFLPHGPNAVANHLAALSTTQPKEVQAQALAVFTQLAGSSPHGTAAEVELYRWIACREIMDTVPASDLDVVFRDGKLVRNREEEGSKCKGLRVAAPFDSAKLAYSAKTYYFLGDADPATPAWQGDYHYEHRRGPAVRVTTKGGGHNPLRLNQEACATQVMGSIASGGSDLPAILETCPMKVQVDTK